MRHWKVTRRIVLVAVTVGLLCCTVAQAKKPGGGGGGGGDGGGTPALLYTTTDSVVTVATIEGQVIGRLTGGSKGGSIKRKATWSPDGTKIAYLEETKPRNQSRTYDVYTMNADGSAKTFIHRFANSNERYTEFAWLPGGYISYQDVVGPAILNMVTGTSQRIDLQLLHHHLGESTIGPGVDPTQPGSQGLIVYRALDPGLPWGPKETDESDLHLAVLEVAVDGSLLLDPTTIRRLDLPGQQGFPVVSPDRLQVAFYDHASGDGGYDIAVVDLVDYGNGFDFGAVKTLVAGNLGEFRLLPTWSPDSQWIAFSWYPNLTPGSEAAEIARIRSDGSEFVNITNSGNHENYPDWFPLLPPQP